MRIAVVSDIHANLQAWLAVSVDITLQHVQQVISLGDLVGYGPNPVETCLLVRRQAHIHLLGNHDAAMCGRTTMERWNKRAIQSVEWTRRQLSADVLGWLESLPYTYSLENCRFAHSEFFKPESFYYIHAPEHALHSWRATPEQLLFVGHTHRPALYLLGNSGTPHRVEPQAFVCEPGKRYIVDVGSVGYPRERLNVSSYCIYDIEQNSVEWRSVKFDCRNFRMALNSQGLTDSRRGEWVE